MITLLDCINRVPLITDSIIEKRGTTFKPLIDKWNDELKTINQIVLIGSGTSNTSAVTARGFIEKVTKLQTICILPNEFLYNTYVYNPNALYVFTSQSGTSSLTNEAVRKMKELGYKTISITESDETPLAKAADLHIDMGCGKEEYGMRTIGYCASILTLMLMGLEIAKHIKSVSEEEYTKYIHHASLISTNHKNICDKTLAWFDHNKEQLLYSKSFTVYGKTAKSILISCGARLAPFDIKELRDLMAYDEMELDTIGDKKTALFLIMSDTDSTFNFVIAILQSQLTNLLCDKADDVYGGRLPVHVRFILDEFANIGQIPQFDKLIATIRSREISASIILQSQSQLKAIYRDNADTIVGNCDTMLFLGGKEKTTLKEISEILGKETIDSFNTSENRGKEISHGLNYQKLGKELMTQDEIATMDGGMCILQLRGVRPFFSKKYDITKHPRYKYLSDADKKNTFDVERYIRVQRKKKKHPSAVIAPEEPFDLYEIELSDEDADFTAAE